LRDLRIATSEMNRETTENETALLWSVKNCVSNLETCLEIFWKVRSHIIFSQGETSREVPGAAGGILLRATEKCEFMNVLIGIIFLVLQW